MSNNIAEGFERGTTAELLAFLYIARGSAGEVRSMLLFCERLLERQIIADQPAHGQGPTGAQGRTGVQGPTDALPPTSEISNLKSQISDLKSQISDLKSLAESCSRQIRGWANHLQNTDIQGQRRLNDKTRQAYQAGKSADAFFEKLQAVRDAAAGRPSGNSDASSQPEAP